METLPSLACLLLATLLVDDAEVGSGYVHVLFVHTVMCVVPGSGETNSESPTAAHLERC